MLNPTLATLSKLIDQACDENLSKPSIELCRQVIQEINSKPNHPKETPKILRKKLIHPSAKVKFLALILTEMAMDSCGYSFHQHVGTKDFMNVLLQLLQDTTLAP